MPLILALLCSVELLAAPRWVGNTPHGRGVELLAAPRWAGNTPHGPGVELLACTQVGGRHSTRIGVEGWGAVRSAGLPDRRTPFGEGGLTLPPVLGVDRPSVAGEPFERRHRLVDREVG